MEPRIYVTCINTWFGKDTRNWLRSFKIEKSRKSERSQKKNKFVGIHWIRTLPNSKEFIQYKNTDIYHISQQKHRIKTLRTLHQNKDPTNPASKDGWIKTRYQKQDRSNGKTGQKTQVLRFI